MDYKALIEQRKQSLLLGWRRHQALRDGRVATSVVPQIAGGWPQQGALGAVGGAGTGEGWGGGCGVVEVGEVQRLGEDGVG